MERLRFMNKQELFIKKYKRKKRLILLTQALIFISFLLIWEFLANNNLINSFITSSPSKIIETIINLYGDNNLFPHINKTIYETLISFTLTSILGFIISILLYENDFLSKVIDPFLTMLNSLPKVALGPIIIIWLGANDKSIIFMAILISLIVCIQTIYTSFKNTDKMKIRLLETFGATKKQILFNVIIPANYKNIINTLKINISMCLIGVIMGEFLTSKMGIGYLILYGSQVFNLDLVMTGIFILIIISIVLYEIINYIENKKSTKSRTVKDSLLKRFRER